MKVSALKTFNESDHAKIAFFEKKTAPTLLLPTMCD